MKSGMPHILLLNLRMNEWRFRERGDKKYPIYRINDSKLSSLSDILIKDFTEEAIT